MEDVELSQDFNELAAIEEEAQTGIVCGVDKTCPEFRSDNVEVEAQNYARSVQTVFGGYNVDQSDTKIVEELQFQDPVHSQKCSLLSIEQTGPKPTEDTNEKLELSLDDNVQLFSETNVNASESQLEENGKDILPLEENEEGDANLDVEVQLLPNKNMDASESQPEENGENKNIDSVEENEVGDANLDVNVQLLPNKNVDASESEPEENGENINSVEENEEGDANLDVNVQLLPYKRMKRVVTDDLDTVDGTAIQTMLTCASLEEYPSKVTRYVEHNTQTVLHCDKDSSNTTVLNELKTKQPEHENEMPASNEGYERPAIMEVNENKGVAKAGTCKGPCSVYATQRGEISSPQDLNSGREDKDDYVTTTVGESTDDGETTDASASSDDNSELRGMSPERKLDMESKSYPTIGSERDDSKSRSRAASYPLDKNQAKKDTVPLFTKEPTVYEDIQDTGAQTQIIFGTGASPQEIDEKASNTYFSYDAAQSDTQIIDELKTQNPVHSGEEVSFATEDKELKGSEESLFNDDWEKNESSGEGEVEVQDINATHSKASDWLPGVTDVEASDTEGENEDKPQEPGVELTLVVQSEDILEDKDGKQKTIQTNLSFGDTLEPLTVSQPNAGSSASVNIMFSLKVGNSTKTMEMKVPKSDYDPNDAALTATFNAEFAGGGLNEKQSLDIDGTEKIRCTLPILVTVTCESKTDESGNAFLEPVVDLTFQKSPSNFMSASKKQPVGEQDRFTDESASQSDVDEVYNNPLALSEDKRAIEIQTDLVLGNLLFSESISSVCGEEGFDTASEGLVHDEELVLPSPPLEEPSSRADVSWGGGSLEDVDGGDETYDDLHLLVDPTDACNEQYVQQLVPGSSSQENVPTLDKSKGKLMKITTAELLYVPDKVSSLTARHTGGKKFKLNERKLHRWGFTHENSPSNITVLPDSDDYPVRKQSTATALDNAGNVNGPSSSFYATQSGRTLTAVATRVIFEFSTSQEDLLSTDGRAQSVKSKIAFQILGSRDEGNQSSHVATLDLKECIAPSRVTFIANGELTSKVLQPEGSPLELPIDNGEPLVLKLALPQPRPLDESLSTATTIRKVPFTIAQVGDETTATRKELELGGSAIEFTVPLGDGCGTMTVTAKVEENSSDEESTEVITMTTTFEEADIKETPKDETTPDKPACQCAKSKLRKAAAGGSPEKEDGNVVPLEEGGKSKTITAMFIKDGVAGEKQTKVLRPGGSPMYVNLPSSGVPVRAKLALAPQPDEEAPRATTEGADLKTKVSCKIIQDGVEKETKTKLMEAGGSPMRFDLPIGEDGHLTANVVIPKDDEPVSDECPGKSGDAATDVAEECVCEPCDDQTTTDGATKKETDGATKKETDGATKKEARRPTTSGDRCFDVITEALATYAREIDPLRKALEEITEKVKELNMPELAGIGEPPTMSYHSFDELDDRQMYGMRDLIPPPAYRHKITLQTGTSRISTTFRSRPHSSPQRPTYSPSSQRQWHGTGQQYPTDVPTCQTQPCPLYQHPTSYSLPDSPHGPPNQYQNEQLYLQQQRGPSHPGGYADRPPRCPYAVDNPNAQPPRRMPQHQDPRGYNVGVRMSQQPPYQYQVQGYPNTSVQEYYDDALSAVNIRSRVYISSGGPLSREQGRRSCNTDDTVYEEYGPQPRCPIAEMYIKLAQHSRSSQFYEEDEESLYDDDDDDDDDDDLEDDRGYGGYQRRGYAPSSSQHKRKNRDDPRRKLKPLGGSKGCPYGVSTADANISLTAIELDKKESYWCDPEDVAGSTKPGNLGQAARRGVN